MMKSSLLSQLQPPQQVTQALPLAGTPLALPVVVPNHYHVNQQCCGTQLFLEAPANAGQLYEATKPSSSASTSLGQRTHEGLRGYFPKGNESPLEKKAAEQEDFESCAKLQTSTAQVKEIPFSLRCSPGHQQALIAAQRAGCSEQAPLEALSPFPKMTMKEIRDKFNFDMRDHLQRGEVIPESAQITVKTSDLFKLHEVGIKKLVPNTSNYRVLEYKSLTSRRVTRLLVCTFEGCTKVFRKWHNFFDHLMIHTNERPYVCEFPECGQSFTQKANLNKHLEIHQGSKRFRCDFCTRCFFTKFNLKVSYPPCSQSRIQSHLKTHKEYQDSDSSSFAAGLDGEQPSPREAPLLLNAAESAADHAGVQNTAFSSYEERLTPIIPFSRPIPEPSQAQVEPAPPSLTPLEAPRLTQPGSTGRPIQYYNNIKYELTQQEPDHLATKKRLLKLLQKHSQPSPGSQSPALEQLPGKMVGGPCLQNKFLRAALTNSSALQLYKNL